jgi:hypothetical protein
VGITGAEPGPTTPGKWRPSIYRAASVLLSGVVAALSMLLVGCVFNKIQAAIPSIPAEYKNGPGFRTWPGWTEGYMLAHPIWFGFVFAAGYALVVRGRASDYVRAVFCGAAYGGLVFVVGSLPVFALVYASFRVSPELFAVSWAARNLAQYVIAGALVALVAHWSALWCERRSLLGGNGGRTSPSQDEPNKAHSRPGRHAFAAP